MTAQEARELSKQKEIKEFELILSQIRDAAIKGETKLHMYKPFSNHEEKLKEMGYTVSESSSWGIQRDSYYGSINW